ncbi:hypothetical protein EVG20_g4297 [Dentipellis fragilis]|uniref:tRNA ligase n=1 Tax=Dentipellis fragilis TaxID=205917 RepID=A0A4Y9YW33_9AGAM|nr:hypothetical protein EVG20_g4297 [Dentipellis fragilis]
MPAFNPTDSQLIADLRALHKASPKLVRSSTHAAPAAPEMQIESWKMNEFKYYQVPSPFPTLARGLFSIELPSSDGAAKKKYRIVARGYDKFFNIGEVPWTTWAALEAHTKPPYALTLKSNGCIILIAALTPTKLLVTSKHSLGPVPGQEESHAQVGERWLRKHLTDAGKTVEGLAHTLWEKNWTAVAELCDDEFEEHVLPYPAEKSGLHLHGLNNSSASFGTQPPDTVAAFAREWGLIETLSTTLPTIAAVREFTDDVARTGTWRGEAVEGFVVRTTVAEPPDTAESGKPGRSPYVPGTAFFFKIKFDEPYMMYRDWREITKAILSAKHGEEPRIPRAKMKRPETRMYTRWVEGEIKRDRSQFDLYLKGKGIIKTRERFLEWMKTEEGKKAQKRVNMEDEKEGKTDFGKTVIMPVAIPGCGKTAVSVALAHLFGFVHTQSDDVHAKKAGPAFIRNVTNLLKDHDIVIADKNNHLIQHRQALRDATRSMRPRVRLLALNWALDRPAATIHRICADRILARGEYHQTLRADGPAGAHEEVLWQFIRGAEPLSAGEADAVIEMDIEETLEDAVARAAGEIERVLGLPKPSREKMGEALALARAYKPEARKGDKKGEAKKEKAPSAPRFFGILAEVDLERALAPTLEGEGKAVPKQAKELWEHLKKESRLARRPHITLVHSKSLPEELPLWERCNTLHGLEAPPLFKFRLGHLVANERIMAAAVEDIDVDLQDDEDGQVGREFAATLGKEVRDRLHITVGTRSSDVNPVEAKALVEEWRKGRHGDSVVEVPIQDFLLTSEFKSLPCLDPAAMPPIPLPSLKDKGNPLHSARERELYESVLEAEQQAVQRKTGIDIVSARLVGYLLLYPIGRSNNRFVDEVAACSEKEGGFINNIYALGQLCVEHIVCLFLRHRQRASAPSEQLSKSAFDRVRREIQIHLRQSPRNHDDAKMQALLRDDYRCIISGKLDIECVMESLVSIPQGEYTTTTECCHIFPESLGFFDCQKEKYVAPVWTVMDMFGYGSIQEELTSNHIHRLENILTLSQDLHSVFDMLLLWFEAIEDQPHSYYVRVAEPFVPAPPFPEKVQFVGKHDLPLPSPKYLAIHAACCRLAHMSGAAEYAEKIYREEKTLDVLAADGKSAPVLYFLLQHLVEPR